MKKFSRKVRGSKQPRQKNLKKNKNSLKNPKTINLRYSIKNTNI